MPKPFDFFARSLAAMTVRLLTKRFIGEYDSSLGKFQCKMQPASVKANWVNRICQITLAGLLADLARLLLRRQISNHIMQISSWSRI